MRIRRALDCGCRGWDVSNRSGSHRAHAESLLGALWLYFTGLFTAGAGP